MKKYLKNYSLRTQAYGEFFSGYPWSIYGCLTFKYSVNSQHGEALVKNFMRRLGQKTKSYIPYVAIPEDRLSGLGAPIRLHYHFLASCPPPWKNQFKGLASELWPQIGGKCDIQEYDASQSAVFYIAKTAAHSEFDWVFANLDHLAYLGKQDLYAAVQDNPSVPSHAKGHSISLKTLVVKKFSPASIDSPVHSIALKGGGTALTKVQPSNKSTIKEIPLPGPTIPLAASVWAKHLKLSFKEIAKPLTPQQFGQLKLLRNRVGNALLPLIEYSIHNWVIFAKKASSQAGYEVPPESPNISFLLKHYLIALQLAYVAATHKKPKKPSDFKLIEIFHAIYPEGNGQSKAQNKLIQGSSPA